jgi:hypothetical protein
MNIEKEKQSKAEIKKPSAFDVETKDLDTDKLNLIEEEEKTLKFANDLLEIGEAYVDKKAPGLRIKLKKDDSIIFSNDFATEEEFVRQINEIKRSKES